MYITKKHLPRRTILRGAGAAIVLPFLEAMIPARTLLAETAAKEAPRFLGLVSAHGWACTYWHDNDAAALAPTPGRNVGLGFVHAPLEPYQDQLTIVAGLDGTSSMPSSENQRMSSFGVAMAWTSRTGLRGLLG